MTFVRIRVNGPRRSGALEKDRMTNHCRFKVTLSRSLRDGEWA